MPSILFLAANISGRQGRARSGPEPIVHHYVAHRLPGNVRLYTAGKPAGIAVCQLCSQ